MAEKERKDAMFSQYFHTPLEASPLAARLIPTIETKIKAEAVSELKAFVSTESE